MYEAMPEMVRPQVPVSPFNTEAPTFKEVQEIVHHKRNAAAPGLIQFTKNVPPS